MNIDTISHLTGFISLAFSLVLSLTFFGKYKEKIDRLEKDFEKINLKLDDLTVDVNFWKGQNSVGAKSPLDLNEYVRQLIQESGFGTVFDKEKDVLCKKLASKKPRTKYDVQKYAVVTLYDLRSENYEPFEVIKKYCYEHGKDYSEILAAGAILLREYYFSKNPAIKSI